MIIVADEHISPRIVKAVNELALTKNWRFSHVIGSEYRSRPDEDWVESFAKNGGNAIISADRAMLKRPSLLEKLKVNSIVAVYLPSEWASSKRNHQAAHILYWWPHIEAALTSSAPGDVCIVPRGFAGTSEIRHYKNVDHNIKYIRY